MDKGCDIICNGDIMEWKNVLDWSGEFEQQ